MRLVLTCSLRLMVDTQSPETLLGVIRVFPAKQGQPFTGKQELLDLIDQTLRQISDSQTREADQADIAIVEKVK